MFGKNKTNQLYAPHLSLTHTHTHTHTFCWFVGRCRRFMNHGSYTGRMWVLRCIFFQRDNLWCWVSHTHSLILPPINTKSSDFCSSWPTPGSQPVVLEPESSHSTWEPEAWPWQMRLPCQTSGLDTSDIASYWAFCPECYQQNIPIKQTFFKVCLCL